MADEDALIRIQGDVANVLTALAETIASLNATSKAVESLGETAGKGLEDLPKNFKDGATWGNFFGEQAGKAFEVVTNGVKKAAAAFPQMIMQTAELADGLRDMSLRTGVSVEALSQMRFVASQTGTDLSAIARVIGDMGKNIAKNSDDTAAALKKIGLTAAEVKAMKPEDAFAEILKRLGTELPNAADRAAAGTAIFGNKFRTMSQLAKEDVKGLMAEAEKLGFTLSGKTANDADRFNDAIDKINKTMEATKNQIGAALIGPIADLLEKLPEAGGALLLVGKTALDAAGGLGNMALQLAPIPGLFAKIGTWATTATAGTGLLATSINVLKGAVTGLTAVLGPLAIAIAGVTAAWYAWQKANEESGWVRELSDSFEYASLRMQGLSEAEADLAIAQQHNMERATAHAAQLKAAGEAAKGAGDNARASKSGWDELRESQQAFAADLAKLNALPAAQKGQLQAALKSGVADMKELAEVTGVSEKALAAWKKQIEDSAEAFKKLPLSKLKEEMKEFGIQLTQAELAGTPATKMLDEFGKKAAELADKARLVNGGFEALPQRIKDLSAAFNKAEFDKTWDTFRKGVVKTDGALQELTVSAGDWIKLVDQGKSLGDQLALNAATGMDKQKLAIEQRREAAIKALGAIPVGYKDLWESNLAKINALFDEEQANLRGVTGNVLKDMEARGYKSKQLLDQELANEKFVLAEMQASHQATSAQIIAQKERVKDAALAASGKMKVDWKASLDSMVASLTQLAQVAGPVFAGVAQGLGTVIAATKSGVDGFKGLKEGVKLFSGGDMLSGIAGMATGIGGIVSAAMAAVKGIKAIWSAFGNAGRDTVEDFASTFGGFDQLHARLLELGDEGERLWVKLTQGVGRNNPEEAQKAIGEVEAALAAQQAATEEAQGATEESAKATIETATEASAALDTVTAKLGENEAAWAHWSEVATAAANAVADAVNAVSFGHSPGGIKEIPLQLAKSVSAAASFATNFTKAMDTAKRASEAVSGVGVGPVGTGSMGTLSNQIMGDTTERQQEMARVREQYRQAIENQSQSGDVYNFKFENHGTFVDGEGMKRAVETEILPRMIDAVDRNVRGSQTKMKQIIVPVEVA